MSKAVRIPLTYAEFAHDLGAHSRLTREVSLVWHRQYTKADTATKQAMREEFLTHFISGYVKCTEKQAMRILIKGAPERTVEQKQAYEAASQKFLYHISRTGAKSKPAAQTGQTSHRIPAHLRSVAMDFLGEFEGKNLEEQIKQAVALLNALK